jgi:2-oxoacid:acceptor oxidoreductase delta subunit (pyruvate/2-ketoisovalerate family)
MVRKMEDNKYKKWREIPDETCFEDLPPVPLSIPDKGAIGFTGEWRTLRPVIDHEKCNQCMFCWSYCPEGVIYVADDKIVIDYDYCKGCGICEHECPFDAIKMEREVK